MTRVLVPAACAALVLGAGAPAAAAPPIQSARDVCTFSLVADISPGLTLLAARRVEWVAEGAITCLGSPAGSPGAITAGTYRSEGNYTGDCLAGQGSERFTARFTTSAGGTEVVRGAHRVVNITPFGVLSGEDSGGLLQILPTGGDCHRKPARSALLSGVLTFPSL